MVITPTPHDAIFKTFLCHHETARDFLRIHLPASWLHHCNLYTLTLEPASFIEHDMRALHSDVLYSMKTTAGDGYIYCLIEHQSSPDKHMTFRLMRYALAAMQRHLDNVDGKLPLVIPVLFYHGETTPYPFSMNWLQAFHDPQLARQIYAGDFPLVDVTVITDDEIMTHRHMATLEFIQKHIRQRDLMELIEQLSLLLLNGCTNDEQFITLINYLLQAGKTASSQRFIRALAQQTRQHGGECMAVAQQAAQWGEHLMTLAEGLKYEGFQEGLIRAKREVAGTMLAKGMPLIMVTELTGLSEDELKQICH